MELDGGVDAARDEEQQQRVQQDVPVQRQHPVICVDSFDSIFFGTFDNILFIGFL